MSSTVGIAPNFFPLSYFLLSPSNPNPTFLETESVRPSISQKQTNQKTYSFLDKAFFLFICLFHLIFKQIVQYTVLKTSEAPLNF